jgi:RNA ligase
LFPAGTLRQALEMPPRPNAEGVVVRITGTGAMVKIKQEDYVALHRILTQTTARTIWELVVVNDCAATVTHPKHWGSRLGIDPARAAEILRVGPAWLDRIVTEVHDWLRTTLDDLYGDYITLSGELDREVMRLRSRHGSDRKAFAAEASSHPHSGALFLLYDGRDIRHQLWRSLYPCADKPCTVRSEDMA